MSDKQISVSFLKIKERAQAVSAWDNMHDAWLDTEEDSDCAVVGHISDGYLYPIAVIDCAQYDQPDDSIKLAEFYASANPKAILELVADFEALKAENEAQAKRIAEIEAPSNPYDRVDLQGKLYIAGLQNQIESLRKQVEALGQTVPTASGFCSRDGGCVCGGDLPRIRESCGSWVKSASKNGE